MVSPPREKPGDETLKNTDILSRLISSSLVVPLREKPENKALRNMGILSMDISRLNALRERTKRQILAHDTLIIILNNIKRNMLKNNPKLVNTGARSAMDVVTDIKLQVTHIEAEMEAISKELALLENRTMN